MLRTSHPTIQTPQMGLEVLERFCSQYQLPQAHEGYKKLVSLPVSQQSANYTMEEVDAILQQLQNAPSVTPRYVPPAARNAAVRGRGRGSFRGYYSQYARGPVHHSPPAASCGDRADIYIPPEELQRQTRAFTDPKAAE